MFQANLFRTTAAAIFAAFLMIALCGGCDKSPSANSGGKDQSAKTPPANADPNAAATKANANIPPANSGGALFRTPESAAEALATAAKNSDKTAMLSIFGPQATEILSSGDDVADRRAREVFVIAMGQRWKLEGTDPDRRELVIGNEQWPFPIPLVRDGEKWRFDTDAGKQEVRARRIGRNELAAIGICETYVIAQKQYAAEARDGTPAGSYAQNIRSTTGQHDGLFWPTKTGEKRSPLGDLAAQASSEGYTANTPANGPRPFHGYLFRILTQQGASAPGGAKSYIADGKMTAGFALVAYPAEYGNSGIMTFIVNQEGTIQEADLGQDTAKVAGAITAYDPDGRFAPVE